MIVQRELNSPGYSGRGIHMVAITFSMLSAAACGFLIYVFVHFHREFVSGKRTLAVNSRLAESDIHRVLHAAISAKRSRFTAEGQQAKIEAVMRKEMLTSAVLGLLGLLAPFIFVMLLNSASLVRH
jgi:hypothetical protein